MNSQFKIYWFCIYLKAFSGILLLVNYLMGVDLLFLFKIPLLLSSLVLLIYHFRQKFYFGFIAKLFFAYFIISIVVAVYYQNYPSTRTLSHLYTFFIATFGVSFGYFFAKNYTSVIDIAVRKYMKMLFWVSFFVLIIYFYGYYISGQITYFGFDSELPTSFVFFASQREFGYLGISLLLIFFSGKRSPLVSAVVIAAIYFFKKINFKKPIYLFVTIIFLFAIIAGTSIAYKNGFLWRFENVFAVNLEDEDSFYIATGGRSVEIMGILNHMESSPARWYVGSGLGGAYYIDIIKGDYEERFQHYTHLSLLSFVFLLGVPFVSMLVLYIFYLFFCNFKYYENKYYLGLIISFVSALFGASMFVDSLFWVFLGINAYIKDAPKSASIITVK